MAKSRYAILVVYLSTLGFLSLNPWIRPVSTGGAFSPDKIDHALAYGGLAVVIYFCLPRLRKDARRPSPAWLVAVGLATLIGIVMEIAQSLFTVNRSGSLEDAAVNVLGAVLGYIIFQAVTWIHSKHITSRE